VRILIVHYSPLEPGEAGGAESAIRDQKQALERLGHEVVAEFRNPQRAYVQCRPDIVHFHTVHVEMGVEVIRWAQRARIAHCLSLHDYWPFCADRMLMKAGAKMGSERSHSCAAVEGICDEYCACKRTAPEITTLVNGSPTVTFNPISAEIFRRNGVKIDAVIGHAIDTDYFSPNGERDKDIMTHSAWPEYNTKGMHILRAALSKIGETATLVAHRPRETVRDTLRKHRIHVFPSCYQETWGLCLTEAMACGLACIASDVAGPRAQIEHGVNGLLFENGNVDQLAEHLRYLLDNPTEVERLGRAGRAWAVEHANLGRLGRDYEAFYRSIIDG